MSEQAIKLWAPTVLSCLWKIFNRSSLDRGSMEGWMGDIVLIGVLIGEHGML